MSQSINAQYLTTGATIGGGGLSFLTQYSSEITVIAVVTTAVASIALGIWNGRIQAKRNTINKRNITEDILRSLESDLSPIELEKIKKSLRK
jgi:Na+/pantothenate symporter